MLDKFVYCCFFANFFSHSCHTSQALNRIRKAVEQRRQERVQKRRLQPVTNPEAAAATRRAKNRRRAEGGGRAVPWRGWGRGWGGAIGEIWEQYEQ